MQPKPTVLAFDTSAAHCAAALLLRGEIYTRVDEMTKGQAEHLMPMLIGLLADHGLTMQDLDAIGVGIGPGNFTGIRISVSAARGLALGLGKPAVGVNGFDVLAYGLERPVSALIPAPRGHAYVQEFAPEPNTPRMINLDTDAPQHDIAPDLSAEEKVSRIAQITAERMNSAPERPAPLYVKAADAAPPKDPAPRILP